MEKIDNSTILVTGGTGSFGKKFTEIALKSKLKKIIILSRDELKQFEMRQEFKDSRLRFFIGDVRDKDRLYRAFDKVDYVFHAAALKQVPSCEYNPFEAVKTNILGAQNIIEAAIDRNVKKVVALSTDKAVQSLNLYGSTKACAEKLFIAGNSYTGKKNTKFSVVRYGNVVGSRGSVIPFFKNLAHTNKLPITDENMTRFWITLEQAIQFVLRCLNDMKGGEIFVPKIPSMRITDLAEAICPGYEKEIIGIRPGEKLHELMITKEEAIRTLDLDYYLIQPEFPWWTAEKTQKKVLPKDFEYCSGTNTEWLTVEELRKLI